MDKDNYLLELSRYIHLNPVRAGIVEKPEDYQYSSYKTYIAKSENVLITDHLVLGLMKHHNGNANDEYRVFVENAIGIGIDNPSKNIYYGGMILGSSSFIKETLKMIKEEYYLRDEVSNKKELKAAYGMKEVLETVSSFYDELRKTGGENKLSEPRDIAVYLTKERTGATNREIGEVFGGLSYSAVAKIYQKIKIDIRKSRKMIGGSRRLRKDCNFKG